MIPFSSGSPGEDLSDIQQTLSNFDNLIGEQQRQSVYNNTNQGFAMANNSAENKNTLPSGSRSYNQINLHTNDTRKDSSSNSNNSNSNALFPLHLNGSNSLPNLQFCQPTNDSDAAPPMFASITSPSGNSSFPSLSSNSVFPSPEQLQQPNLRQPKLPSTFPQTMQQQNVPDKTLSTATATPSSTAVGVSPSATGAISSSAATSSSTANNNNNKLTSSSSIAPPTTPSIPPTGKASQRIPCKARGIKGRHDATNSYIEIPPNVQHGTILTCSNPQCILTGRLFQFCIVCQLPVSKANFQKRHGHEDIINQKQNANGQPKPGEQQQSSSVASTIKTQMAPLVQASTTSSVLSTGSASETFSSLRPSSSSPNLGEGGSTHQNDMRPPKRRRARADSVDEKRKDSSDGSFEPRTQSSGKYVSTFFFPSSKSGTSNFKSGSLSTKLMPSKNGNELTPLKKDPIKIRGANGIQENPRPEVSEIQAKREKSIFKSAPKKGNRMPVDVTEKELQWIYLFKQRPSEASSKDTPQEIAAREKWIKDLEKCSGISIDSSDDENDLIEEKLPARQSTSSSLARMLPPSTKVASRPSLLKYFNSSFDRDVVKTTASPIGSARKEYQHQTQATLADNYYASIVMRDNANETSKKISSVIENELGRRMINQGSSTFPTSAIQSELIRRTNQGSSALNTSQAIQNELSRRMKQGNPNFNTQQYQPIPAVSQTTLPPNIPNGGSIMGNGCYGFGGNTTYIGGSNNAFHKTEEKASFDIDIADLLLQGDNSNTFDATSPLPPDLFD